MESEEEEEGTNARQEPVCVVFLPLAMADGADPLPAPERGSVGGDDRTRRSGVAGSLARSLWW
jgi:hypothetical protein